MPSEIVDSLYARVIFDGQRLNWFVRHPSGQSLPEFTSAQLPCWRCVHLGSVGKRSALIRPAASQFRQSELRDQQGIKNIPRARDLLAAPKPIGDTVNADGANPDIISALAVAVRLTCSPEAPLGVRVRSI
jgi:hypothetical protein